MASLNQLLAKCDGPHLEALQWFDNKRGRRVSWKEMKAYAETGPRLSTAAKGIYKPKYTDFALSVRTVQDGPYPDKEVEYRPDGSWVCQYFQENSNPELRDKEATNRGLMLCLEKQIPVGFLIKRKPKPGVEYDVLGLGLVTSWDQGYFTIEGFARDGSINLNRANGDAAYARLQAFGAAQILEEPGLPIEYDNRDHVLSIVAVRRGQGSFRNRLLEAYQGRCCVTGCDVPAALEAAHIIPYRGEHSNLVSNGLLLRSDIHTLFDQGLLSFDDGFRVVMAQSVGVSDAYRRFIGKVIALPKSLNDLPCKDALKKHRGWSGL